MKGEVRGDRFTGFAEMGFKVSLFPGFILTSFQTLGTVKGEVPLKPGHSVAFVPSLSIQDLGFGV